MPRECATFVVEGGNLAHQHTSVLCVCNAILVDAQFVRAAPAAQLERCALNWLADVGASDIFLNIKTLVPGLYVRLMREVIYLTWAHLSNGMDIRDAMLLCLDNALLDYRQKLCNILANYSTAVLAHAVPRVA